MVFILNVLFGLVAGVLTDFVLRRVGVADPAKVLIAVIVGIVVFLANFAAQVV